MSLEKNSDKDCLRRAYNRLVESLKVSKRWSDNSVLASMLNIKSNERLRLLGDCSLSSKGAPKTTLKRLHEQGLIRPAGSAEKYILTAAAIVEIERDLGLDPVQTLLRVFDEKYFSEMFSVKGQALSSREKATMLTLLLVRAFSEAAALDLKRGERSLEAIKKIVLTSATFLKTACLIEANDEKGIFGQTGNEHPVSNMMRHSDALPKKSLGIFQASKKRNQSYFLDLFSTGEIDKYKLGETFWLIFRDKLTDSQFEALDALSKNVLSEYGIVLFDDLNTSFYHPKYSDLFRKGYEAYQDNKSIWAEK